jgi:hypothetical protein
MKSNQLYKSLLYIVLPCILLFASLSAGYGQQADRSGKKKLYISAIKASGVSSALAARVRNGIKLSIFEGYGTRYHVLDDEAIRIMFKQAEAIMASGCDDKSCVTQIADGINADDIVYGEVSAEGPKLRLNLNCLERKGVQLGTKSIVNISFFESQFDHFIAEAGKKLMNPAYRINLNAEITADTGISLTGIKLGRVEGLDISVMKFTSTDEVIGQMIGFLKDMVENGDRSFNAGAYGKARGEYISVLDRIHNKLMPAQQAKMTEFVNGVEKRVGSSYAMEFKKDIETVDSYVSANSRSDEKNLNVIIQKYETIQNKIAMVRAEYAKDVTGVKKPVEDRLDSAFISLAGYYENKGIPAYREYKFEEALDAYSRSAQIAEKIYDPRTRQTHTARYNKKIETVRTTGEGYLANRVKTLVDQTSFYNLKDESDNAKKTLERSRQLIMNSKFATPGIVSLYNEMAGVIHADTLTYYTATGKVEENPEIIASRQQAREEKARFYSDNIQLQLSFRAQQYINYGTGLNNITEGYADKAAASIKAYNGKTVIIDNEAASSVGTGFEFGVTPRIFLWYFGFGLDMSFYNIALGKSISKISGYVEYTAQLKETANIPMLYIRPLYGNNSLYLTFGAGYGKYKTTIKTNTDVTLPGPSYPNLDGNYHSSSNGYRFIFEGGWYMPSGPLMYIGLSYSKRQVSNLKNDSGQVLIDPTTNQNFHADISEIGWYFGAGISY